MGVPQLDVRVGALDGKIFPDGAAFLPYITIAFNVFMVGSPSNGSSLANSVVKNLV